jgi:sarcosine oxidase
LAKEDGEDHGMQGGSHDAIVIGLGAMGSATCAHLARRGHRVLGLDTFGRGHNHGSSHGTSRIIREAYLEAPEYVPLVQRAYVLWRELEAESERSLLTVTGGLCLGRPDGSFVSGVLRSAAEHQLPHESLSAAEVAARFPAFRIPEDYMAVYEPRAGFLQPEACIAAHLDSALRHGADLRHHEPVLRWALDGEGVRVETEQDVYRAERLVITAGPWASELLEDLALPLTVRRVVNVHFQPAEPERFSPERCPVHIWQLPEGEFYGFPNLEGQGIKFGRHDGNEPSTPRTIRRAVDEGEIAMLRGVLDRYMPAATGPVLRTLTCMYTMTPDQHFILDLHPGSPRVVFGCGFSGHGFKFAAVIGEILADLALTGRTAHDIGFLSARRFGVGAPA